MHRYLVVIENAGSNYSAYSPDLPGCVATGPTPEETKKNMAEAIEPCAGVESTRRERPSPLPSPAGRG